MRHWIVLNFPRLWSASSFKKNHRHHQQEHKQNKSHKCLSEYCLSILLWWQKWLWATGQTASGQQFYCHTWHLWTELWIWLKRIHFSTCKSYTSLIYAHIHPSNRLCTQWWPEGEGRKYSTPWTSFQSIVGHAYTLTPTDNLVSPIDLNMQSLFGGGL